MMYLRGNTFIHEICLIRAFDRWRSCVYIKYFVRFNIFDLNLVFRRYLPGNDYLTCFSKFYACFREFLTEFTAVGNFN